MKVEVDLAVNVGTVGFPNPVLTASGTAGYGAELGAYIDLAALGAVVVKSLSPQPWGGNPSPRVHETVGGMLNAVGLHNVGVAAWLADHLPALRRAGARVVASIWGRTIEEYGRAAAMLKSGASLVVITQGIRGVQAWHGNAGALQVETPKIEVIDTIGDHELLLALLQKGNADTLKKEYTRHLQDLWKRMQETAKGPVGATKSAAGVAPAGRRS